MFGDPLTLVKKLSAIRSLYTCLRCSADSVIAGFLEEALPVPWRLSFWLRYCWFHVVYWYGLPKFSRFGVSMNLRFPSGVSITQRACYETWFPCVPLYGINLSPLLHRLPAISFEALPTNGLSFLRLGTFSEPGICLSFSNSRSASPWLYWLFYSWMLFLSLFTEERLLYCGLKVFSDFDENSEGVCGWDDPASWPSCILIDEAFVY